MVSLQNHELSQSQALFAGPGLDAASRIGGNSVGKLYTAAPGRSRTTSGIDRLRVFASSYQSVTDCIPLLARLLLPEEREH